MLSVQSIEEFPQPITYETHQDGLEVLQNMTIAQRFTIENLFVDMINSVEQIDSHALIEDARYVIVWKQFSMEASDCKSYSDLGRMVQRLQKILLLMVMITIMQLCVWYVLKKFVMTNHLVT
ncbi:unnamed protein product [Lathyrus oleraceus]